MDDLNDTVAWLRSPATIRQRCGEMLALAEAGTLDHFAIDSSRLATAADEVVQTIRTDYPTLDIPYHSRWRHFDLGGIDRWQQLAAGLAGTSAEELARIRIDLAVTSVLLDAGAGAAWRFRETATGNTYQRSEGLAIASFVLFEAGGFSSQADAPLRADAAALEGFSEAALAAAFQVNDGNPLVGLPGRAALMQGLGTALRQSPNIFGAEAPRIGNLFNYLADQAEDGHLPAAAILAAVLQGLEPIWPGRIRLDGVNLADVWPHPKIGGDGPAAGLVPLHKLSQWLTYSLVEPLEDAGIVVTDLDALTGLAEYRNGGLMVDTGLLAPKHDAVLKAPHEAGSEVIVEWRALTVALLDRVADAVRARLGLDASALPLPKVLQGGTWSAGRRLARERRAGGEPPITLSSDGTVF